MENVEIGRDKLDTQFVNLLEEFKNYLLGVKDKFDSFELEHKDENERISFLIKEKKRIFKELDSYFEEIWDAVKDFEGGQYRLYQRYFQKEIHPIVEESAEINKRIYEKPLGYSGDYVVMNYIYDYNSGNYLGKTLFDKLINNYTCNIPISTSNIERKDFFKGKILDLISKKNCPSIMSLGGGPLRELSELLEEKKIGRNIHFTSVDFEKKAIEYAKSVISNLPEEDTKFLTIDFIQKNVVEIARKGISGLNKQDLIYSAGLFDYLGDRICKRLIFSFFELLESGCEMIVCNMSLGNSSHRAYYETLGEWDMVHRKKKSMLSWIEGLEDVSIVNFEGPKENSGYLYLTIRKS
jgi:hypothetical protein